MANTIVGLYEDRNTAHRVVAALKDAGFTKQHIQFASNESGGPGEFESDASSFRSTDALAGYGIAQDEASADGAWVHAYLHRVEGDLGNAGYWYRQAGQQVATDPLEIEWERMVSALLGGGRA